MSERPLRIGIVYDDTIDRRGGIGVYVTTLGRQLVARGHHVEYLLGTSRRDVVDSSPVHSLARNVGVRFNGNVLSMPVWTRGRRLDAAIARGFDVLHVQVPYSPLMAGRLVRRAASSCAVVGTFHVASDRPSARFGALGLRVLKAPTIGRFDEIVSVSNVAASFARQWGRIDAAHVVPNLLACAASSEQPGTRVDAEVVFVGRLVPRKGVRQLVQAMHLLARDQSRPASRLAVIGDGPLRRTLEHEIATSGTTNVTLYGELDDASRDAALQQAQIACLPSMFGESFGLVLVEAIAAGSEMVLGGDNPGYRELLADDAALVDGTNPHSLAARIAHLLADSRERRAIGQRQQRLVERCAPEAVTEEVLALYDRALRARRDVAPLSARAGRLVDATT